MAAWLRRILTIALLCAAPALAAPPTVVAIPPQPLWAELSVELRTILSPLGNDWNDLENYQRKTWLGIAERWPTLTQSERNRAWDRMRAWAKLSPEERREIRDRYRRLQELSPEERARLRQQWETYGGRESGNKLP